MVGQARNVGRSGLAIAAGHPVVRVGGARPKTVHTVGPGWQIFVWAFAYA
jgi:hypothetical protein